jgi:hypothetical protein
MHPDVHSFSDFQDPSGASKSLNLGLMDFPTTGNTKTGRHRFVRLMTGHLFTGASGAWQVRQDGKVFYEEVLTALVQKATGVTLQQLPQSVRTNLIWETRQGRARAEASDGNSQAPWLKPADMDASDVFAVKLIQAAARYLPLHLGSCPLVWQMPSEIFFSCFLWRLFF